MKTLIFIGIVVFFINASCNQSPTSPVEELKLIGIEMQKHAHVKYSYILDTYRSYSGQSPTREGVMYFKEDKSDTIIGMKFRVKEREYESFYDGKFNYTMMKADSSIFKKPLVDFHKNGGTVYPTLELSYCAVKLFLFNPNIENEIDSLV